MFRPIQPRTIPHLAGQRATYIAKQLKAYQKGERVNPFMAAIAKQLSDADVDNVAAFWNGQATGSDTTPSPEVAAINKSHMAFPKDFPKGFTLFLTANDAEKNEIRTSYINGVGFAAAKAGKAMSDGTVIIVVHQAAKLDANKKPVVAKDGSWVADKVAFYAGMEAEANWGKDIPELLRNADWNYAAFSPAQDGASIAAGAFAGRVPGVPQAAVRGELHVHVEGAQGQGGREVAAASSAGGRLRAPRRQGQTSGIWVEPAVDRRRRSERPSM